LFQGRAEPFGLSCGIGGVALLRKLAQWRDNFPATCS
jgi:hypothetical protein